MPRDFSAEDGPYGWSPVLTSRRPARGGTRAMTRLQRRPHHKQEAFATDIKLALRRPTDC